MAGAGGLPTGATLCFTVRDGTASLLIEEPTGSRQRTERGSILVCPVARCESLLREYIAGLVAARQAHRPARRTDPGIVAVGQAAVGGARGGGAAGGRGGAAGRGGGRGGGRAA